MIGQSPLEPYYSSSPLTSSSDSDSQGGQRKVHSDIDDLEDQENIPRTREPYHPRKDPLHRRSYPFIFEDSKHREAFAERSDADRYLLPPPVLVSEDNTQGLAAKITGLNDVKALGHRQTSLLSLSKLKDKTLAMDEHAYDEEDVAEKDVLFADQNGFTIALPANSPTVSTYAIDDDKTKFPALNDESEEADGGGADLVDESGKKEIKRQTSAERAYESPLNTEENRQRLRSLDKMPGADIYFLPPLIAQAITNKAIHDGQETEVTRDKNSNLKMSPMPGLVEVSSMGSTEEESEDENVYLENADDIFHDLQEKDFMGTRRINATPEEFSDTGSAVTRGSVDPIENILTRKDDVEADNRTFTLNGRAVITPKSGNTIARDEKPITAEEEVASAKVEAQELTPEIQDAKPIARNTKPIHSHRVGDDKKCDVCNPKSADAVPDIGPDCCVIL